MPRLGGPRASKRRVLASVIHSELLYSAPVWHVAMSKVTYKKKLTSFHGKVNLKVSSAYRTVSSDALNAISSILSIHILVEEQADRYNKIPKDAARANLMHKWQEEWMQGKSGR
ncbi:uncharacterized protein LOC115885712 [Sitophilus oryzae]|uniref:Uncharacterized protein LOC115885712 n=1 Tax=Sitophilus oryzae TaxID=7048 RepID=A0A6J2YBI2_SITOR|nr:uncharacterized protein LOC115885712 [Sitophilus oryzae]